MVARLAGGLGSNFAVFRFHRFGSVPFLSLLVQTCCVMFEQLGDTHTGDSCVLGYSLSSASLLRLQVQLWKVAPDVVGAVLLESASVDVTHCIDNDLPAHEVRSMVGTVWNGAGGSDDHP
jgi:hypothetical protein